MLTPEDCYASLREAANILGHSPSRPEYNDLGLSPSSQTIYRKCGGWNDAKEAAGVDTVGPGGSLSVNESYFKELDTPEKAYWMGFLYGDGSVFEDRERICVKVGLSEQDESHVHKFKDALDSDHSVSVSDGVVSLTIANPTFSECVVNHGLTTEKTHSNSLPEVERNDLRAAFVRGLFDADGHSGQNLRFNITGSNRDRFAPLIEWLPVDGTVQDRGDGQFTLRVGSEARLRELYSWLYPDGKTTTPALDRKLKKIPEKWIQKKSMNVSPK